MSKQELQITRKIYTQTSWRHLALMCGAATSALFVLSLFSIEGVFTATALQGVAATATLGFVLIFIVEHFLDKSVVPGSILGPIGSVLLVVSMYSFVVSALYFERSLTFQQICALMISIIATLAGTFWFFTRSRL